LAGRASDVAYLAHFLVFPRSTRPRKTLRIFIDWMTRQLGVGDVASDLV
jgi:hypothetical protein